MIHLYRNWLEKQAKISTTQPLTHPVDSNDEDYLSSTGFQKLGWRHFRRELYFLVSGQNKNLGSRIQKNWKKGLWIYKGIPQIGDALMDLAPRTLLCDEGISMDLYTDKHLTDLFDKDPWFTRIIHDPSLISSDYDFVIVPSHKSRSLKHKIRALPDHKWVSIHEFYTGPEFHRGKFCTQRILDLLKKRITPDEFHQHQRQKLKPIERPTREKEGFTKIALTLGGVDPSRTYNHWQNLIKESFELDLKIKFTLIGSSNAENDANQIVEKFKGNANIINEVNRASITDCRLLINDQHLLIASDGGLMHLGATTGIRMISLFHSGINPKWRLSGEDLNFSIQSQTARVSDIPTAAIIQHIKSIGI